MKTKKHFSTLACILMCILLAFQLCGCYLDNIPMPKNYARYSRRPDSMSDCIWESTDGTVKFTVGKREVFYEPSEEPYEDMYTYDISSNMYGEITLNDGTVCKFFILYDDDWNLRLFNSENKQYRFSDLDDDNTLVYFKANYRRKDRFYAEVVSGTLFEVGTEFEFHRTIP